MSVIVGMFEGIREKNGRKREWQRMSNIEIHFICVGRC
jgi:hypothetical protein